MFFGGAIQNAIFLYLLLVALLFTLRPDVMKIGSNNQDQKSIRSLLPIALIIIAIVSYYFFASLEWFHS